MTTQNETNFNDNSKTYQLAMELIASNNSIPVEFRDEFSVFEMIAENNKLEELNNLTVQPLVVFYNDEVFYNDDTQKEETAIKTYVLVELENGSIKMYNGFSLTFRLKFELLKGVFKDKLPKIHISKVSKGMKQEYIIKPIRG